jgi:hypothetical protein
MVISFYGPYIVEWGGWVSGCAGAVGGWGSEGALRRRFAKALCEGNLYCKYYLRRRFAKALCKGFLRRRFVKALCEGALRRRFVKALYEGA